jgi:diguanylate cyclase (GGDEF)-like protein
MIIRHRFTLRDLVGIAAVLAAALVAAWQIDLFPNRSVDTQEKFLEVDELFAIAALGFALFSASRLAAQKRETRRRTAAEQRAPTLAMEDALTGLANRRRFEEGLAVAAASAPSSDAAHALFMLDLNGFKKVNDVHGHAVGDEALVEVAARLRGAMREGDLVARLGGDEFAVLSMHVSGAEAATGLGRRIIDAMQDSVRTGRGQHAVGAAIGVALLPQDGTVTEAMRKADIALYRAKAEGVSSMRFFEPGMDDQVRERDQLERELRAAVEQGVIEAHFQPQIDLRSGAVIGFEALARWTHPTMGEVPPTRFIPAAEDCGVIGVLSDALLRQACQAAATWPSELLLSFNLSPTQLRDAGFGLRLMKILADTGLPPSRLELELTESALVRDLSHAQQVLGQLRDAGVKIALDDFGTGYSSLYHLRAFKLDKIKIDRSFVEEMERDPEAAAIVRALIGLGAGLSLDVVAEGVETAGQASVLLEQGCLQAQGFRFSKALSASDALALVSSPGSAAAAAG